MVAVRGKTVTNKFGTGAATPLYQGHPALEFDTTSPEELQALTAKQQVAAFASKWQRVMEPFERYKSYLRPDLPNSMGPSIVRQVKNQYKHYCVEGDWPQRKYVMVVDYLLTTNTFPAQEAVARVGSMYDLGTLPFQLALAEDLPSPDEKKTTPVVKVQPKRRRRL